MHEEVPVLIVGGTPAGQMAATAYYAGFAGAHGDSGRRILGRILAKPVGSVAVEA